MRASLRSILLGGAAWSCMAVAAAASCPQATVADMMGLEPAFPQQFELAEFEEQAGCDLAFAENPMIGEFNARILGNPAPPPVAERLPEEPLVVAPYAEIGRYGGVVTGLSNATEAGTSDLLSVRHVNLVRYSDDLQTIVPNVAKGWSWNEDFTELTFTLRRGHKWSNGEAFTAEDVAFWYNDLILNPDVYERTPGRWLFGGEPAEVEAVDEATVVFRFAVPAPGILNRFAVDYGQAFQPKHFLGRYMDAHNPDAAAAREADGFASEAEAIDWFYGGSDWKDVPQPLLKDGDRAEAMGVAVMPTLESHIVVEDTSEGRRLVANPYFHQVDTAGHQLPYIPEIHEEYVPEKEVRALRIMNGEVVWKQQGIFLEDFPLLKENEGRGDYTVALAPTFGENVFYSFNRTHKDPVLREVFNDIRFLRAMSVAMNREELNEIVYLGQGTPSQAVPAEPKTVEFVTDEHLNSFIEYNPTLAGNLLAEMGLRDNDGDGVRELPDGRPFVVRIVYSNQGAPVQLQELMRDYWSAVGVRVDLREVTSDEYRAAANNNDLDVTVWKNDGIAGPTISQDTTVLRPPFGDVFNPGTGFEWANWLESDGAQGTEPPQWVKDMVALADEFVTVPLNSERSNEIGAEITSLFVDNLVKIGTVGDIVAPYVHRNDLTNVQPLTAKTYDFYWVYPYRPQQWFLSSVE